MDKAAQLGKAARPDRQPKAFISDIWNRWKSAAVSTDNVVGFCLTWQFINFLDDDWLYALQNNTSILDDNEQGTIDDNHGYQFLPCSGDAIGSHEWRFTFCIQKS
jgi:hypothetical protein